MRLFETKENRERWRELTLAKYERSEDTDLGAAWGTKNTIRPTASGGVMVYMAIGFSGTKAKPDFNYMFRSPEERSTYIEKWLEGLRRGKAYKAERKAAKKAVSESPNPAKVGDILCSSWGYDQTNVDWYQVVETKGKNTVVVRRIAANSTTTGWERGDCSPVKDRFLDPERHPSQTCRVNKNKDGYSIKVRDFAWAYYCPEGENASHYWTSYH
jgi:hypothetical protein